MRRHFVLILIVVLFSGCSVHKEGISLGGFGHKFSSIEIDKCESAGCPEKVIIIGTVSALRKIGDDESIYAAYVKASKKFKGEEELVLNRGDFRKTIAAWTLTQTFHIPLVGAYYKSVFIPQHLLPEITFPSTAETFLVQGTGDLVSAYSNEDGVYLVDRLLCKTNRNFKSCKSKYRRGIFDGNTGKELNGKYVVLPLGKKIDINTYKEITNKTRNEMDGSDEPPIR